VLFLTEVKGFFRLRSAMSVETKYVSQDRLLPLKALDFINDGVMICDQGGQVIYADPAMSRMLSIKPSEVVGRKAEDLLSCFRFEDGQSFSDVRGAAEKEGEWSVSRLYENVPLWTH